MAGSNSVAFGGGGGSRSREQEYDAAVYSGQLLQTSTFSSVRSTPTASSSLRSQLMMHQLPAPSSGMQQHSLDDLLQSDSLQEIRERRHPASPAAISSAEAASLKAELQASDGTSSKCIT